jgi:hypothetical protein
VESHLAPLQPAVSSFMARIANDQRDPCRFLTDVRDEIKPVVNGIDICGAQNAERVHGSRRRGRSMNWLP